MCNHSVVNWYEVAKALAAVNCGRETKTKESLCVAHMHCLSICSSCYYAYMNEKSVVMAYQTLCCFNCGSNCQKLFITSWVQL